MNYPIKILKEENKKLWNEFLNLKTELILYNKHTLQYKICKRKIFTTLKNHTLINNSINILKKII